MNNRQSTRSANRAAKIGLATVLVLGLGVLGATLIGNSVAGGGWKHHDGRHWGAGKSAEDVEQHTRHLAAWVAGTVDADPAQATELEGIFVELGAVLFPLREQYRLQRLQLITEISRPEIDAVALENVRQNTLALADQATAELTQALLAVADVLEAEQRQQLSALAGRFGHRRHH